MSNEIAGWFAGRIPDEWFGEAPEVHVDREEIVVLGSLRPPPAQGDDDANAAARRARATRFREDTRDARVRIAEEAEHRFGRKVSWGVRMGGTQQNFTTLSVPVMTRLRIRERKVLDTLVDAGVARSRSDALAWCVRLVGDHQGDWIEQLRQALGSVENVRAAGPRPGSSATEPPAEAAAEG